MQNYENLKLKAVDMEGLNVLSCLCQDALINVHDIVFDVQQGLFDVIGIRVVWEAEEEETSFESLGAHHRVHFGIRFADVLKAQEHGIGQDDFLNLLAVLAFPLEEGDGFHIHLTFSDDKEIRLTASGLKAFVQDLDEPWPISELPHHDESSLKEA
ncbi:MAG TPA: DUF2948 family protein [Alphaproteobacteria bacterium]|nr:DUF2948 family protein [Alphaproteobacteria bacterium]